MATIRDVARRAGVSAASVSRVLKNDTTFSVSQKTREGKGFWRRQANWDTTNVLNTQPFKVQEEP